MKKPKSYKQYLEQAAIHNASIMEKYGAPPGAKPPMDRDPLPAATDAHYRKYAFIKKRRLEDWPKSGRKY